MVAKRQTSLLSRSEGGMESMIRAHGGIYTWNKAGEVYNHMTLSLSLSY